MRMCQPDGYEPKCATHDASKCYTEVGEAADLFHWHVQLHIATAMGTCSKLVRDYYLPIALRALD